MPNPNKYFLPERQRRSSAPEISEVKTSPIAMAVLYSEALIAIPGKTNKEKKQTTRGIIHQ